MTAHFCSRSRVRDARERERWRERERVSEREREGAVDRELEKLLAMED